MQRLRRRLERVYHGTINGKQLIDQLEAFPTVDLDVLTAGRPVLILAPHADDESLGCGGLIAEACRRGHTVHVVILTDGTTSHLGSIAYPAPVLAALRKQEALDALAILGLETGHVTFMGLPDGRLPQGLFGTRTVVRQLRQISEPIGIATVFATSHLDMHPDHVATYRYGRQLARLLGATFYAYPVWGLMLDERAKLPAIQSSGISLDITANVHAKRRAVMSHVSQTSDLITDAVSGFKLNQNHLDNFITNKERFISERY